MVRMRRRDFVAAGAIKPGVVVREPSLRPPVERRGRAGPDYRVTEWGTRNVPRFLVRTVDWRLMMADSPESKGVDALAVFHVSRPRTAAGTVGRAARQIPAGWLGRVRSSAPEGVKARET
jgi:hypothetical protein